jgi:PilZ domain
MEKRAAPRKKKRPLVDFDTTLIRTTGFTNDISLSGLFVRTIRIPQIGKTLRAVLHLPDGKQVALQGRVVRSYRAPSALRALVPTGFGLRVSEAPDDYTRFASS